MIGVSKRYTHTQINKYLWQSLNGILSPGNVHDRDSRDFTDSSLQVPITCGDNVAAVLEDAVHETVIGVGALV